MVSSFLFRNFSPFIFFCVIFIFAKTKAVILFIKVLSLFSLVSCCVLFPSRVYENINIDKECLILHSPLCSLVVSKTNDHHKMFILSVLCDYCLNFELSEQQ